MPECTDKLCERQAEFAYRFGDGFSRVRNPEDASELEDGDLAPFVCETCRDRMAQSPHWDESRFVRPEETLIPVTDGGNSRSHEPGTDQGDANGPQ